MKQPPFDICVIGLGLIGGSLAIGLRESGFARRVVGVDQNPAHGQKALELGLCDTIDTLENAVKASDIILVTTPVHTLNYLIPKVLDIIQPHQMVLDAGSTKHPVLEAVAQHAQRARFVATHPMAGTEYSGPTAAVRGLFEGKRCVFCNAESSAPDAVSTAKALYEALGMNIAYLEGADHDLHVAYISHISHIASFALALTVLEKEKQEERIFELASGGFSSTARLAKSNAETWIPIFTQNRDNVLDVLDEFINTVSQFRTILIKRDFKRFDELIRKANEIGRII
jgi:prephenate dehydrogenase